MTQAHSSSDTSDREIVITRLFNAPRELVWQVFTDPQHKTHWWGPRGFRTTTHSVELKSGGIWRYTMHGPDGRDYPNEMRFHEVLPQERLVYSHGTGDDDYPHKFEVVTTFTTEGEKTRVTMRSLFQTAASRDHVVKEFGAIEGGNQTMDRFEEQLSAFLAEGEFVITRTVNAPRNLVWKLFTQAEHLQHWWGPKGMALTVAKLEVKPGGIFLYTMTAPNGFKMWGKFVYREIAPPERLIFVVSFSDENGGIARHPMAPNWPLEMLNVMTFTEKDGKTTLTLRGSAFNATASERQTYKEGHDSMRNGFGGTWDQLEAYIATLS